jgi:hypothetical protein
MLTEKDKTVFVSMMKEKKDILFGAFSPTLTKDMKAACWQQIIQQCGALGIKLIPHGKDWTYVRDIIWCSNVRMPTIRKVDKTKKTGSGFVLMTDLDNLVLDVIGRDSEAVKGINVCESWTSPNSINKTSSSSSSSPSLSSSAVAQATPKKRLLDIRANSDLCDLKQRRMEAQIQSLEAQKNYYEIKSANLENRLQLQAEALVAKQAYYQLKAEKLQENSGMSRNYYSLS